jgi:hypothetical protein
MRKNPNFPSPAKAVETIEKTGFLLPALQGQASQNDDLELQKSFSAAC